MGRDGREALLFVGLDTARIWLGCCVQLGHPMTTPTPRDVLAAELAVIADSGHTVEWCSLCERYGCDVVDTLTARLAALTPPASETVDAAWEALWTDVDQAWSNDDPFALEAAFGNHRPLIEAAIRAESDERIRDADQWGYAEGLRVGRADSDERVAALRAALGRLLNDPPELFGPISDGMPVEDGAKRWYMEGWGRLARDVRAALSDAAPEDADTEPSLLHPTPP